MLNWVSKRRQLVNLGKQIEKLFRSIGLILRRVEDVDSGAKPLKASVVRNGADVAAVNAIQQRGNFQKLTSRVQVV